MWTFIAGVIVGFVLTFAYLIYWSWRHGGKA